MISENTKSNLVEQNNFKNIEQAKLSIRRGFSTVSWVTGSVQALDWFKLETDFPPNVNNAKVTEIRLTCVSQGMSLKNQPWKQYDSQRHGYDTEQGSKYI